VACAHAWIETKRILESSIRMGGGLVIMQKSKLPTVEDLSAKINNTLVAPETTLEDLTRFVLESKSYGFGAVVIQGCWVREVKELLKESTMKVSVGVGYPMGGERTESKLTEIKQTATLGADMFDVMPNIGFLKSGLGTRFKDEIASMVHAASGRPVRVMLEYSILNPGEKVEAAVLSEEAGVAGVKNSSGWGRGGPATVEDIRLLRKSVSPKVYVKASGGIRTLDTALSLIDAGAAYLGTRAGVAIIDELRERRLG
jgi:deoxyribose-phosphate aldolase